MTPTGALVLSTVLVMFIPMVALVTIAIVGMGGPVR